jgi:hypothetical protein
MIFHRECFLGSIGVRAGETFPGVGMAGGAGLRMADIYTSDAPDAGLTEKAHLPLEKLPPPAAVKFSH